MLGGQKFSKNVFNRIKIKAKKFQFYTSCQKKVMAIQKWRGHFEHPLPSKNRVKR